MDGARPVRVPARHDADRAQLADRGAAADAAEQPRPRGRRAARRPRRLRRHRPGRPRLAQLRRDRPHPDARCADDETLLVQSGKPVGVLRTHEWAPRVLIANSNLVGDWATWPEFRRLEHLGLTMYGQMTAGSWIYIGTQGILQGTYETFAAVAAKRFGGTLAGTLTLTGGCGGMGGAQPLAVTLNGGVCLVVDVDAGPAAPPGRAPLPRRGRRRPRRRHRALPGRQARPARAVRRRWSATPPTCFPELLRRGVEIDIVTDQTSAHDPLSYLPEGVDARRLARLRRRRSPRSSPTGRARRWPSTSRRWSASWTPAPRSSTTATRSATRPGRAATTGRSPSPASCPPTSGRCSARARARSAGPRSPATRRTSPPPTAPSSTCSPTTTTCTAGSARRRTRSPSRACRPGSAGSATASATWPGCGSTSWSPPARSARRS